MTVKISGIVQTRQLLNNVEKFLESHKPMEDITDEAIEIIRDKTESGVDYMGRRFRKYSQAYAKKKGSFVNLKVTGKMLSDIVRKIINAHHGKIFIRGAMAVIGAVHSQGTRKCLNVNS